MELKENYQYFGVEISSYLELRLTKRTSEKNGLSKYRFLTFESNIQSNPDGLFLSPTKFFR